VLGSVLTLRRVSFPEALRSPEEGEKKEEKSALGSVLTLRRVTVRSPEALRSPEEGKKKRRV
jgi:hypothetical protein